MKYRIPVALKQRFALAVQFVDTTPVRNELRAIAARLLQLDYALEPCQTREQLETTLRHTDLPFAYEEYIRQQLDKSTGGVS